MKIVVIGGTGRIGSRTVACLREAGHEAVAAAPSTGVNILSGEGLDAALASADVVIDLANSPSFEDDAAMTFFRTAGKNIFDAERHAGVKHHVALSVVGTDRLQAMGYFRAKQAQEDMIRASGIPYTIIHSTQFFEFLGAIAQGGTKGDSIHLSDAPFQPIASEDVAQLVAEFASGPPLNRMVEIAGPERAPLAEMVGRFLKAAGDKRKIVSGRQERYFGLILDDRSLVPDAGARHGRLSLAEFLARGDLRL